MYVIFILCTILDAHSEIVISYLHLRQRKSLPRAHFQVY